MDPQATISGETKSGEDHPKFCELSMFMPFWSDSGVSSPVEFQVNLW
jgi:hypothetical protein